MANRSKQNPYADPDTAAAEEAAAAAAFAEAADQALADAAESDATSIAEGAEAEPVSTYPVTYYNPKVINEQFYLPGTPYRKRFVNGRFVANNEVEEAAVRACLAAWGREKADKWRGDTMNREWEDRKTGFRTFNEEVRWDFEFYHNDFQPNN